MENHLKLCFKKDFPVSITTWHKSCCFGLVFSCILTVHNGRQLFSLFSPGTSVHGFFNRAREVDEISELLKQKPRFTVLLGPPSSGKTALAQHNGSFLKAFMHQGILAGLRNVFWKDMLSGSEFSIVSLSFKSGEMKHSAETAANIFNQLGNHLKPWSPYHGNIPPVLVINEANAFKRNLST
ncbi:hypothetical protein VP01_908g3 [Puccinia sorghi]|uniref:Uncharacterized protein n=1 Tax=Puccinia sorghi TaxID=27349 RepID=A0A0L6U7L8_9BASI|nr:hypothetical protein VP01_908g3 [Puccinia sorghi]